MSLLIAVLAAVGYAGASTLQSAAVHRRGVARTGRYAAGLTLDGAAWALSLMALRSAAVYVVQAILASSLALTVVFARIWQQVTLRARDIAAISALIPALAVIANAGHHQAAPMVSAATTTFLTVFGCATVAAVGAAAIPLLGDTVRAGWLPAALAAVAVVVAVTAVLARTVPQSPKPDPGASGTVDPGATHRIARNSEAGWSARPYRR